MYRRQKVMGAIALVVTLACIGFVTWAVWPKPDVVLPHEATPAADWIRSFGTLSAEHASKQDAFYWATSRVTTEPTEDKQGVVVSGFVNTSQELALLKEELSKVQPGVPITWQVTIGR